MNISMEKKSVLFIDQIEYINIYVNFNSTLLLQHNTISTPHYSYNIIQFEYHVFNMKYIVIQKEREEEREKEKERERGREREREFQDVIHGLTIINSKDCTWILENLRERERE